MLEEEFVLANTAKEREEYESLAEIYSIIVSLDEIEKAYLKDTVPNEEYTVTVQRLIAQYNTLLKNENTAAQFGSIEGFKTTYGLTCAHATSRLEIGHPATVEHAIQTAPQSGTKGPSAKAVAEATGNFITVMDALKLNYRAKDQLHPLMSELLTSVNKVSTSQFNGRQKLVEWIVKINKMKVNEELSDEEVRELLFELDAAYKGFYSLLE